MIVLHIDTARREEIKVGIEIDGRLYEKKIKNVESQAVLPLIQRLLESKKIEFNQIDNIRVNTGPGSFTGLRVGIAIANALSFALGIPINSQKLGRLAKPVYVSKVR
ncbi:tRNA (adenosine(37)-N6)-threonylcarbamoyltransferase complex dimerization subunit type 1 TsaB [Patescibacteria group bacterium]|nr:tRNA (adenosine(37)-N6)-threonylcarbamoyltransferase complex dimerization subunit type 1 TsaB [Patescibacteria group bacterium]MCL5010157.1 tRNA (adenosine(37)-N6)-threonylcarbamoyltransferase complex dimerization subunit type 1 TsaB [Patescibacteria group bacterium]